MTKSSLVEAALASQSKGPECSAGVWVQSLSKQERAEVEEAFATPEVQHAALCRAIKDRWPDGPKADSITRHRKKECTCDAR
jgi:hypothetical protein